MLNPVTERVSPARIAKSEPDMPKVEPPLSVYLKATNQLQAISTKYTIKCFFRHIRVETMLFDRSSSRLRKGISDGLRLRLGTQKRHHLGYNGGLSKRIRKLSKRKEEKFILLTLRLWFDFVLVFDVGRAGGLDV